MQVSLHKNILNLKFIFLICLSSCATINKEDCLKDMYQFGLAQGKMGNQKKITDEILDRCMALNPNLKPEDYEKGFYTGWSEFCNLRNAFALGKKDDKYISFCPIDKEKEFKARFQLGKSYHELKSSEEELLEEISDYSAPLPSEDLEDYKNTINQLDQIKKRLLEIDVESANNNFSVY